LRANSSRRERAAEQRSAGSFRAGWLALIRERSCSRDETVKVPQLRSLIPEVVPEIQVGGAVHGAVWKLEPDRLVHADAIATHGAPQKPRRLIHPNSSIPLERCHGTAQRQDCTTGLIRSFERRTTDPSRVNR